MGAYFDCLRGISYFESLSDDHILKIENVCREESYDPGHVICMEKIPGDCFYIIIQGSVEIWKDFNGSGKERLAILRPGEMFGEIALIDDLPRSATVISKTPLTLLSITRAKFQELILNNPIISLAIMRSISSIIRRSNEYFINELRAKNKDLEAACAQLEIKHQHANAMKDNAEKELKQTTTLLETIFNSIPDVLGIQTINHDVIRYNKAGYDFLRKDEKDVIGKKCYELLDLDKPCSECVAPIVNKTGQQASVKKYFEGKNVWMDVRAYPVLDENGSLINIIEHLRDITEEKRAEENFFKSHRMEALGTLAGGIAHNFNNLLQVVQGNISFILLNEDTSRIHRDEIQSITESIESGANLTKQLLGFARTGKYLVRPVNMNEILEHTSQMFESTCRGIKIHKYFSKKLWPVEADKGQLELVLLNLYINARQAMEKAGSIYLETENVEFGTEQATVIGLGRGRYVKVSVTDTGLGMDENIQDKIFEPFFTTKEEGEGTGLGLASAYGIIKRHGGLINFKSEKGKGTSFNIYLPASDKKVTSIQGTSLDIVEGNETILLVDDEETVIKVGEMMLKEMGYKVIPARGGRMALEKFKENMGRIHIIILDMIMPGMDGGKVYDEIKELQSDIKVLLSSGYRLDGQAQGVLDRGCDSFIQKPFDMANLSLKIREVLEG